jgi:hypothetical protein
MTKTRELEWELSTALVLLCATIRKSMSEVQLRKRYLEIPVRGRKSTRYVE